MRKPIPIACTLEASAVGDRVTEWRKLLAAVVERRTLDGGVSLQLPARPELAAAVADLAMREQGCCAFFEFSLRMGGDGLWLDVTAPPDAAPIVETLFGAPDPD
jgi:hypothetical protein